MINSKFTPLDNKNSQVLLGWQGHDVFGWTFARLFLIKRHEACYVIIQARVIAELNRFNYFSS